MLSSPGSAALLALVADISTHVAGIVGSPQPVPVIESLIAGVSTHCGADLRTETTSARHCGDHLPHPVVMVKAGFCVFRATLPVPVNRIRRQRVVSLVAEREPGSVGNGNVALTRFWL